MASKTLGILLSPTAAIILSISETSASTPLLIYGVTSACGAFAAKFARLAGFKPIIGVAGKSQEYAQSLVDYVVDYRNGEDALVSDIERIMAAVGLSKIPNVFDAISENGSLEATLRFLEPNGGNISVVLPPNLFARDKENFVYPDGVRAINTAAPQLFTVHRDFAFVWTRYMSRVLGDGRLKAHPYEVVPGGVKGVLGGLQRLKRGEASAVKFVYRVEETGEVDIEPWDEETDNPYDQPGADAGLPENFPFPVDG